MGENEFISRKQKRSMYVLIGIVGIVLLSAFLIFYFKTNGETSQIKNKLDMAAKYLDELEYEQAIALYKEVLDIDTTNVEAFLGIAEAYVGQGDFSTAFDYAQDGYELTSDERLKEKMELIKSDQIKNKLDMAAKYLDELEYEQAIALYKEVLDIDTTNAEAFLGIVEAYIRQNNFETALDYAKDGYELTGDEGLKEKAEMIESGQIFDSLGRALKYSCFDANGVLQWWHQCTYNINGEKSSVTHYSAAGQELGKVELEYNENGDCTVNYGYYEDGTLGVIRCTYQDNLLMTETWEELDGTVEDTTTYEYDEDGLEKKSVTYHEDGGGNYSLYQYKDGKCVREDSYDLVTDDLLYSFTWSYDENGKCTSQIQYNADGALEWRSVWEYDEKGNLYSRTEYDENGNITGVYKNE